ncbi:MAG: filamentous hemagglutinin N-terminal domain-containing protein, partial [Gammaproteobacteria bacterium]
MFQRGLMATSIAGSLLFAPLVQAGPEGGTVIEGDGSITQVDEFNTHIDQLSQNLLMEFDSFDISADESVLITQPNASAWFVGNVIGGSPTAIFGNITANGKVALVNASGVIFGETASINAAGVFASALGLSTNDLFDGESVNFNAEQGQGGYVVNHGLIAASVGGAVTLLGETVSNTGVIMASLGQINLASGSRAVVNFGPEQLIGIEVTDEVLENNEGLRAAVTNTGTLDAQGGAVLLTSSVSKSLFDYAINNEGVVKAKSAEYKDGVIRLFGSGSGVLNTGTLDASSEDGKGGRIDIASDQAVQIEGKSLVTVSGAQGGGDISITAGTNLTVDAGVELAADAIREGDGGSITLAGSDVSFAGSASARGGELGGDGGEVTITARDNLDFSGSVDVSAPAGEQGTLTFNVDAVTIDEDDGIRAAALENSRANVAVNANDRVDLNASLDL